VLIEICGVDGAGKSSLIDRLRRHLAGTSRVYERVIRSDGRNALEWAADTTGEPFAAGQVEAVVILDVLRQAHGDLHLYRQNPTSHVFVSFYHAALLARLHRGGLHAASNLHRLLDLLPRPDHSFRITVPADVALARLRSRVRGDTLLTAQNPAAAVAASVAGWAAAARRLPYGQVVLDGTQPADLIAERAAGALAGRLTGEVRA
jgi:thymidylate kinase